MNPRITNRLPTEALPHNDIGYRPDFEAIFNSINMDFMAQTQKEWAVVKSLNDSLRLNGRTIPDKKVPNVVGMGLRDALYLLENRGLQVKIVGSWKSSKTIHFARNEN